MDRRGFLALLPFLATSARGAPLPVMLPAVVASFSILADMARVVGGDAVGVGTLVPTDGDPHVWQPKPADMRAVAAARVLVENGLGLEGWMVRLPAAAGFHGVRITAANAVKPRTMTEDGKRITDPHAWQDPRNGVLYVRAIQAGLAKAVPEAADGFAARADAYVAEIARTDDWITQQYAAIPQSQRRILTSHDAFGYYGARYGITLLAVQGISTEGEPSAHDIARLITQVRREHVRAVFVENMTDPRLAKTVAQEAGAVLGPTVYSDALSAPDGPAGTYLSMLRYNTMQFTAAMVSTSG